tara:strand:- start:417 stop:1028 length:612 start_codon:yes stop_codon:yes gene_type:complete
MDAKICGIKNSETLKYLINHKYPPKFIGFICNYPKSKRHIKFENLKSLVNIKKKIGINFVSVLVKPDKNILKKINSLNFDYLQLYDVSPKETLEIKNKFKIKIISAITVNNLNDVNLYKKYKNISEIILFDSKGYEKSKSFDHTLLNNVSNKIKIMLAGNIKYNEKLDKYKKITDIIDLSGSLETKGEKDISKINIFLNNMKL